MSAFLILIFLASSGISRYPAPISTQDIGLFINTERCERAGAAAAEKAQKTLQGVTVLWLCVDRVP